MLQIRKWPIALFGLLMAAFPFVATRLPGIEHYTDILVYAGIYALITIGLSLLMGYAGQISLGHAAFYGIGAYVSGALTVHYSFNPWMCMVLGMVLAAAVAFLVGAPSLKLRGHYLAMATLAFGIIIFIVFNEEAEITGGPDGLPGIPGLSLWGFEFDTVNKYYYLVWALVMLAFILTANIIQSRPGRALRAIHVSEPAAAAMGVPIARVKIVVFVYSAVLASLAGSLYAHYLNFINPSSFDLFFSVKLVIMIALGGIHQLWGAVLGAIFVSFLGFEWLHYFQQLEILVYGAILLLITIFLPDGLSGLIASIAGKLNPTGKGEGA